METTTVKTASKVITKGANVKKETGTYKIQVLGVNSELKKFNRSLGGCRSVLLNNSKEIGLTPLQVKILQATKKPEVYKVLQEKVRTSKNGNYSPFYVLQAIYKNSAKFQELSK